MKFFNTNRFPRADEERFAHSDPPLGGRGSQKAMEQHHGSDIRVEASSLETESEIDPVREVSGFCAYKITRLIRQCDRVTVEGAFQKTTNLQIFSKVYKYKMLKSLSIYRFKSIFGSTARWTKGNESFRQPEIDNILIPLISCAEINISLRNT